MTDRPTYFKLNPPYTVYAVALLYFSADGASFRLSQWFVNVSGENPLTDDEVTARARREIERDPKGPQRDEVFKTATVGFTIIRS